MWGNVLKNKPIPYGRQSISENDIRAVIDVLGSDWLTQGPSVERFEHAVASYSGASFAVAVNSATSALHIACLAAGLGLGDTLWTSPNTFVASANCALYCGASVDFVDIDPHTYNMSADELEKKLINSKRQGRLPKVVIPVHFAGQSCEIDKIFELSKEYGFTVIEDASHAIGGKFQKAPVGGCRFSDMAVFSFHPIKIITTGEGGMVLTNSRKFYEKLVRLRSHGITRDPALMEGESHGPWYYQQIELGFNYRMTDIQAALGASQMERLDEFVRQRHRLAKRYDEAFVDLPVILPWQHPDTYSAFHLYVIRLRLDRIGKTHRQVFEELRAGGILVNLHYIPVHIQPYYRNSGFSAGDFPEAERYYSEAISLPLYSGLAESDQDRVICALREVLQ
jgi:UDP-4-amino-4,6-dideoxy-N-acetyl-beta-L-altrosamine transaminase